MIFLHSDLTSNKSDLINKYIKEGKQVFILFYMEGCGPCNATRPEWKKLKNVLENKYKNNNIVVAEIDQETIKHIKNLKTSVVGFPTMIYIANKGSIEEKYEDSTISSKNRSIDSFVEWIESHVKNNRNNKTMKQSGGWKKKHRWSMKYKKSINCRRPKGFSQRNYCKYGRKK